MKLITIGVYGFDEESFFQALLAAGVDVFCDIRQRRGVRGATYAFANSQRLQRRLAELGIPVYEVRPGIIRTDMTAAVASKYDAQIRGGLVPQRRWGTPDDVGRAVAALATGDVPYATGAVVVVDGGLTSII